MDLRQVTDGRASLPVEVDDAIAAGPTRQLSRVLLRPTVDQHFYRLAGEPAAPLGGDARGRLEEPQVAAGLHAVRAPGPHGRRGGAPPPRVGGQEYVFVAHAGDPPQGLLQVGPAPARE